MFCDVSSEGPDRESLHHGSLALVARLQLFPLPARGTGAMQRTLFGDEWQLQMRRQLALPAKIADLAFYALIRPNWDRLISSMFSSSLRSTKRARLLRLP